MRFFVAPLLALSLFVASDATAFFGCFSQMSGGVANINSGTCNNPANGLWDSYCTAGNVHPYTNYSYGSGFGAYAYQIPPARGSNSCCSQPSNSFWYGGGHRQGCSSCSRPGCGGGCSLGSHLQGLVSRLRSHLQCQCCSAGANWVGGGPLDSYSVAPASGFDGGVDYGYIDSCSDGGCAGGCGGDVGGEVIMHSEGAVVGEPTPAM